MKYRTATLLPMGDLGGAGTKTIEVNVKDIISRIVLNWKITKGAEGMNAHDSADLTKIELVDGSDLLFSMTGGECQALCLYDRKVHAMNHGQHASANSQFSTYGIDFGRKLYDPELALDPSRFRNLQLKVTHNEAVSDTSADVGSLEVLAECFDEKPVTPQGFLMSKEIWNAALPLAGYTYVDLPTDYPIRQLLLKAYKDAYEPWALVDQFRIDEDNEKRIPFDFTDLEAYYRKMKSVWTPILEEFIAFLSQYSSTYYLTPTEYYPHLLLSTASQVLATIAVGGRGGAVTVTSAETPYIRGMVMGYLPNHCFQFPFGDPQDLDDWYDVTKIGSCRARLEAGGTDVTTSAIVLQQLRRY